MTHRFAGSSILAAAALASIATSAPVDNRWVLEDTVSIETTQVQASVGFGITAEARGPRAGHQGGEIDVFLEITPSFENLEPASITITLTPEADPSRQEVQQILVGNETGPISITLISEAWQTCEAGPCFEDYLLEIANATANTSISVNGDVRATLRGRDENPEPDSEVLLELTAL